MSLREAADSMINAIRRYEEANKREAVSALRMAVNQPRNPHTGEWVGDGLNIGSFGQASLDDIDFMPDEQDNRALELYAMDHFALPINQRLRSGDDLGTISGPSMTDEDYDEWGPDRPYDLDELVDDVDRAVTGMVTRDISLWRGVALTPEHAARFSVGVSVVDAAYMSTSIERGPAEEFASIRSSTVPGAEPYVMQFLVKKGTRAAPVPDTGVSLAEIMLSRDLKTRVVSREGNRIVLEVL